MRIIRTSIVSTISAAFIPLVACDVGTKTDERYSADCTSISGAREAAVEELRRYAPFGLSDGDRQINDEMIMNLTESQLEFIESDEYLDGTNRIFSFNLFQGEEVWRITTIYDEECRVSVSWGFVE